MFDLIKQIIEERINPMLALHNGSCELVGIDGEVARVRLLGGCVGCPSSRITLYNAVAPLILEANLGINEIVMET